MTHVDVSSFASKTNLASLKTEVDKIDVEKLKTVPVDLAKLSNVVKNDVVKKTEYNKLVIKVDNIDTTNFVSKIKYDSEIGDLKLKIPDTSGLLQTSVFNSEITEVENKIPDVKNLAIKNDISSLVKKTDCNTKTIEIEGKINNAITTAALVKKTDLDADHKKANDKTSSNISEIISYNIKLKQADTRIDNTERNIYYFRGKIFFGHDGD